MNHTTLNYKSQSPCHGRFFSAPISFTNPKLNNVSVFAPTRRFRSISSRAKEFEISAPEKHVTTSNLNPSSVNGCSVSGERSRANGVALKHIDVATLGNLCVDIVLNVPQLPPQNARDRRAFMDRLAASPPDEKYWEAGGNCNMAIAAARLGMHCVAIGHVGNEVYGGFLLDVLQDEGIGIVRMCEDTDYVESSDFSYETLLCWVLVDPLQRHGFCSRADFSKEPAFSWLSTLSTKVKTAIKRSKILFCNGYGFDELSPNLIISSIEYATDVGTAIFFDPGPRGKSLSAGSPEEQRALNKFLMMSDVLLLTSDEAETLTGIGNPILAGNMLLKQGVRTKWVIIKMGAKGSILITKSSISCVPAFKVDLVDTVGCGDSFVAAIAFGFINNMPLVNTLAIANAVGAATATGCGAGRNVATLEKVTQLMRNSDLNEDDTFSAELFGSSADTQEITILSKEPENGNTNRLNRVSFESVVSELLPVLESVLMGSKVPS